MVAKVPFRMQQFLHGRPGSPARWRHLLLADLTASNIEVRQGKAHLAVEPGALSRNYRPFNVSTREAGAKEWTTVANNSGRFTPENWLETVYECLARRRPAEQRGIASRRSRTAISIQPQASNSGSWNDCSSGQPTKVPACQTPDVNQPMTAATNLDDWVDEARLLRTKLAETRFRFRSRRS